VQLQPTDCDRARESISAQLDGELTQVELDRLELHLLGCVECSQWAEQVRDVTAWLREAPLEEPAARFALPRLRRSWRVSSAVAVASAAAVVATLFVPGHHGSLGSRQAGPPVAGLVGVRERPFVVSRLTRLEDGTFFPVTAVPDGFRHV
jgi:anti-sigma factor RsiW